MSDKLSVEIGWFETIEYTSTIHIDRASYDEWFDAEVGDKSNHRYADGWIREYVEAGEESDWFDQIDSVPDDMTNVTVRQITHARATAGLPRKQLTEPMTDEQLRAAKDEDGYVTAIAGFDLDEIIDASIDACNELFSHAVTGDDDALEDISWEIVGHDGPVTVLLQITGTVDNYLERRETE